jgi:Arc/MetJ-type ribon-helix-helix transcriptional regulator
MPKTRGGKTKPQQSIALPEEAWKMIDELVEKGLHGSSRGEVARSLILDQLKMLARDRLLPPS